MINEPQYRIVQGMCCRKANERPLLQSTAFGHRVIMISTLSISSLLMSLVASNAAAATAMDLVKIYSLQHKLSGLLALPCSMAKHWPKEHPKLGFRHGDIVLSAQLSQL